MDLFDHIQEGKKIKILNFYSPNLQDFLFSNLKAYNFQLTLWSSMKLGRPLDMTIVHFSKEIH